MDDDEAKIRAKKALDDLSGRTAMRNDGEYYRSPEFREEVIRTLMEHESLTREQAENRTRDSKRLHEEAIRLSAIVPTLTLSGSRCNRSGFCTSSATLPLLTQLRLCCIDGLNPHVKAALWMALGRKAAAGRAQLVASLQVINSTVSLAARQPPLNDRIVAASRSALGRVLSIDTEAGRAADAVCMRQRGQEQPFSTAS
jgi:hypothetical protein